MLATFTAGFILIMVTLVIVLNLVRSRSGRAIMALRDNRIAAESVGINVTKYKLMAFVTSAALAGAAGALYGHELLQPHGGEVQLQHLDTHPRIRRPRRARATSGAPSSPPPC